MAEFFIPSGAAGKLTKATETAKPLTKLLARTAVGTGEMAIPTALQTGGDVKQTAEAAVLGGAVSGLSTGYKILKGAGVTEAQKIDRLAGTITQGQTSDIQKAKKALSDINIQGVKTYDDLAKATNNKIQSLSTGLDDVLSKNPTIKKLSELNYKIKVGSETLTHNYTDDAIKQLDDLYAKTGDIEKQALLRQFKATAQTKGLNLKELNDLAKLHGSDINAFNANGEAASGLAKQAAENTRKGLKSTARELFGNSVYKATDEEISNLIRVRDLSEKMAENVNTLKQKITDRSLGNKIGRSLFNMLDTITGGTTSGFIRSAVVPRGGGLKVMNAIDLENALQKNLKEIQGLMNPKELGIFKQVFKDILPVTTKAIKTGTINYLKTK